MEYIICLVISIIAILIIEYIFNFNLKNIKEVTHNKKLDELTEKFPENEEICRNILKKINNENVNIKQNLDAKDSLYVAISDTIFIANIKDTYTRIQTIAHECIHSIQSRKILLFNFYFTNIYLLYFITIVILTMAGIIKNYNLQIMVLLILSFIQYMVRSYLETDAMEKAPFVAEKYMNEYIEKDKICTKEEIEELVNEYHRINKIGISAYNFVLFRNNLIKIALYLTILIIKIFFFL